MSSEHWSKQEEVGGRSWQLRFVLFVFRLFGPVVMRGLARFLALFFYWAAKDRRRWSKEFLGTVYKAGGLAGKKPSGLRHFRSFSVAMVDKMAAWAGLMDLEGLDIPQSADFKDLVAKLQRKEGVLALCSHLGNVEILRALGSMQVEEGQRIPDFRILAIVEFDGTGGFNEMLETIESNSMMGIIPVSQIGPDTIIRLKDFAADGGMIVIAGDRTSPSGEDRSLTLDFLGRKAKFPYGSFLLADLLELPVYSVFAVRGDDTALKSRYRFCVKKSDVQSGGGRRERNGRIEAMATFFKNELELMTLENPYQWFNFYPYWGTSPQGGEGHLN